MTTPFHTSKRPARVVLALAAAGAGIALAASASAATASCAAPATDAPGGKCRISYTASDTFTVPRGVTKADVLVVGGGGGGGGGAGMLYGGGGGGVATLAKASPVTPGAAVAVTVGKGGAGGRDATSAGGNGEASSFGAVTAAGGGGAPADGIGGTSGTFTGGQFFSPAPPLSFGGGGGAGASANGASATGALPVTQGGAGGAGLAVADTFSGIAPATYGGGGGGAGYGGTASAGGDGGGGAGAVYVGAAGALDGAAATANTGGGGGGGAAPTGVGGAGGSGIVVVQYDDMPILAATVLVPRKKLVDGWSTKLAIRATNSGSGAAMGAISCLTVPAKLVITDLNGGRRGKGMVCFTVGEVAGGATVTRSVTVRAVTGRKKVTVKVGGNVRASGITTPTQATPVKVSIKPRATKPAR